MQRNKTYVTAIAILLAITPFATATWMVAGTVEPNTPYDTASFMFQQAPPAGAKRVYFNVITQGSEFAATGLTYNPNVAMLDTKNEAATGEFHEAVLGLWTDCNGDGYIGMAETAVREYPSELISNNPTCPPVTGDRQKWVLTNGHNYNGIVSELIPIARDPSPRDARLLPDDDAKVWGDFDRPDEEQHTRRCALRPLPRGTAQSTGGLLNYMDCRVDVLGPLDAALSPVGLGFSDTDDAHSGALGNVFFGSEDSRHAAVTVADCSATPILRTGDELNKTALGPATQDENGGGALHDNTIRPVAPAVSAADPTTWTPQGQLNQTNEEFRGDCDTGNDRGADFYGRVEGDNPQIDPHNKKGANWNFFFATSNRGGFPVSLVVGRGPGSTGINENDFGTGWGGSRWIADSLWGSKPGIALVKADLQNAQVGLPDAYWLSFFAYVGPTTTGLGLQLPGGSGKYGSWHCGSFTSGIHNGWNCDASTWYLNPDGSAQAGFRELERAEFAYPGQTYVLRDVDCYDGSNSLGVPVHPAGLGNNACP